MKKRKTIQKRTKKKSGKKKTKKTDKTSLPTSKLHNADDNTVVTHEKYVRQLPYSYEIQYNNKSQQKYTPFVLKDQFQPKFRLPTGVTPSVTAMCNLLLPDSIIDGTVIRSSTYAKAHTQLDEMILVNGVMKRNPV